MNKTTRVFILFFIMALDSNAQFTVSNYNSKNGFPHDLSYRLIEDSSGYLYIGTDNGLVRYNGSEFALYNDPNLNSKYIIDVVPINQNEMALATWGSGIHLLNGKNYRSIAFKSSDISGKYARVLMLDSHIVAFDDKVLLSFFYKKKANVYETYTGGFGIKDSNYCVFDNNGASIFIEIEGFDKRVFAFSNPSNPKLKGLIEIHANRKTSKPFPFLNQYMIFGVQKLKNNYVALTDFGLIYFNEKGIVSTEKHVFQNKKILKYTENECYKAFVLLDIKTNLHEVRIVTKANQSSYTLNNEQLQHSLVSQIYLSPSNSVIWISTYGNGLYKLVPESHVFSTHLLKSKNCIDFKSIKGYHLFLTANELLILDSTNQFLKSIAIGYSQKFDEDTEKVNIASRYGVSKESESQFRDLNIDSRAKGYPKNFGLFNASFGGNSSIITYVVSNKQIKLNLSYFSKGIKNLQISNIVKFDKAIYLASNQGVFAFDTLQFLPIKSEKITQCRDVIMGISVRDNKLWVATRNRILNYSLNHKIDTLDLPEYFEDNINNMLILSNGDVWLASQKGFIIFKKNQFYQLNYKHGYPSSFTTKIVEEKNGDIYLLGNNGFSIVKNEPNLIINPPQLLVNNSSFSVSDSNAVFLSGKSLEFKVDHLNYYALDVITEYQFNNQDWQLLKEPSLHLLNLKDGNYSVQFRSRFFNSDFKYSKKYSFDIKRVWYLRPYVLVLWSFILLSVLTYSVLRRYKKLRLKNQFLENTISENKQLQTKVEEMRQNVAQDFHDELGNKIAGISMLSDKLLTDEKENKKVNTDLLQRINRDSKELYSGIRDFIWAIDSKNDDLQELIFTLTDFAEDLFQHSGIKFRVTNRIKEKTISLPLQWNRQLLLLFKEVMTNSLKHSKAKNVELIFDIKTNELVVQFWDDGLGFDLDKIKRGNGLNNIYKRASKINGIIEVKSNSGTLISFKSKLA